MKEFSFQLLKWGVLFNTKCYWKTLLNKMTRKMIDSALDFTPEIAKIRPTECVYVGCGWETEWSCFCLSPYKFLFLNKTRYIQWFPRPGHLRIVPLSRMDYRRQWLRQSRAEGLRNEVEKSLRPGYLKSYSWTSYSYPVTKVGKHSKECLRNLLPCTTNSAEKQWKDLGVMVGREERRKELVGE